MKRIRLFLIFTFTVTFITHGLLLYLLRNNIIGFYHIGGIFLYSIGGISPTFFALYLIFIKEDKTTQQTFITSLIKSNDSYIYWLFATFLPLILGLFFVFQYTLQHQINFSLDTAWYMFIPIFLYSIFVGGLEEIGWRGYLQEKLRFKLQPLTIGIIIGVLWAAWHLPLLFMSSRNATFIDILPFLLGFFMFNLYLTWLYDKTRNLLLTILFHASINATRRVTGFRRIIEGSFTEYLLIATLILIGLWMLLRLNHTNKKTIQKA